MRRRILHLHNYSNWGGNLAHLRLVLAGLAGDPDRELFLAAPPQEGYLERFRGLGVGLLPFEARSRSDVRAVWRLVRLVRSHGIDLVHSHLRRTDWICAWSRLLCPGRVWVTTVHGEVNLGPDYRRRRGLRSAVYGRVLARFDRVLAVSEDLARRLALEEGVRTDRLTAIANGVAILPPSLPSPEERQVARRSLGIPEGAPTLLTMGRFGRRKGHEVLLRAAAREAAQGRPWEILLLGDGDLESGCRALAGELGLGARARFHGFQADTLPFLLAAEVLVAPSHSEGLPRALLEGMVAGLAPVASDIGGVREALEAPRFGLTFPAGDDGALAAHLSRLRFSPDLRRTLGERARARILERYSASRMVEQHRRLYDELLRGRSERRRHRH